MMPNETCISLQSSLATLFDHCWGEIVLNLKLRRKLFQTFPHAEGEGHTLTVHCSGYVIFYQEHYEHHSRHHANQLDIVFWLMLYKVCSGTQMLITTRPWQYQCRIIITRPPQWHTIITIMHNNHHATHLSSPLLGLLELPLAWNKHLTVARSWWAASHLIVIISILSNIIGALPLLKLMPLPVEAFLESWMQMCPPVQIRNMRYFHFPSATKEYISTYQQYKRVQTQPSLNCHLLTMTLNN